MKGILILIQVLISVTLFAQHDVSGTIQLSKAPLPFATVEIVELGIKTKTNKEGDFTFKNINDGNYSFSINSIELENYIYSISVPCDSLTIEVVDQIQVVEDVVITGTMREVSKKESTVNVEVFTPTFFKKNPTPSVYEALQNVNGVRPQLNCNICNTGDIHINGLEGPYTMILIDGMPIVSSLSTVYGLSGIPNSLVERIEIVKGPASTLYGSEAVGGIINIITKLPGSAPKLSADVFTTSWLETNVDIGMKFKLGKADILTGINYFNYSNKQDKNNDNFTDVTLQDRISVFQKWNFKRKSSKVFSIAGRYVYEDRWGGEMDWNSEYRGGEEVYGESIYTSRWELIGTYQLPLKENIFINTSVNNHSQNSFYGSTSFQADQFIAFSQVYWDKQIGRNNLVIGSSLRYIHYDDDTQATSTLIDSTEHNSPSKTVLPGIFIQNELKIKENQKLLAGIRYDHHTIHGSVFSPRLGYKLPYHKYGIARLNLGTGYRVVNVYTEDHAALTGARNVVIDKDLSPEKSYNANLNLSHKFYTKKNRFIGVEFTAFFTYFNNRILPDYTTNSNEIRYSNINGYAISQGASSTITFRPNRYLSLMLGGTYQDVFTVEDNKKQWQLLTEKFSGNWTVSYRVPKVDLTFDYTGNVYSPMILPLLGDLDPRPEMSPWWSIQNIQVTFKTKQFEFYGGVKNLLNWTPAKETALLIAGSHDPFDENVSFDANGNALPTTNNPYALTFDPAYVYAPNQGIRGFLGIRYSIK